MVAVADVFDALTHQRPYKEAWPLARAVEEIALLGGTQFDPAVARTFAALDHSALLAPIARTSLSAPPAREDDPFEAVLRR
jgi:HD-GYP domain-containing protein (c-di-GMP phosphodiesterase class II)